MRIVKILLIGAVAGGVSLPGASRSLRAYSPQACQVLAPAACLDGSTSAYRTESCEKARVTLAAAMEACAAGLPQHPHSTRPGGMSTPAPAAPGCNSRVRYALCVSATATPPAAMIRPLCDKTVPAGSCDVESALPYWAATAAGVRG